MIISPDRIARRTKSGAVKDFLTDGQMAWTDYDGAPLIVTVDGIEYVVFCKSRFERDNGWKKAADYIANHYAHRRRVAAKEHLLSPFPFRMGEQLNGQREALDKFAEAVNHPDHYNKHPSGIECIDVVEHMGFNLGNVVKYIWRMGIKPGVDDLEDLKKARWYLDREIQRIEKKGESQ